MTPAAPSTSTAGAAVPAASVVPPSPARRAWLALAAGGALSFVGGCASRAPAASATGAPSSGEAAGTAVEVAPGVHAWIGARGVADAANGGRIGNAGLIVGRDGALAVDSGASFAHGRALLAAMRARAGTVPLRALVVTLARPEFLFGARAFRDAGIPLRMQPATADLMARRCETCLKNLTKELGPDAMAGSVVPVPDERLDAQAVLDVEGLARGAPVTLRVFPASSGPGDLAVFDAATRTLFAGGFADHLRIPDLQDGRIDPWLAALDALLALRPRHVVPGHGPVGDAGVLVATAAYLRALDAKVRELLATGASLLDVADAVDLPAFRDWDGYDTVHRRNASIAFLQREREALLG